MIFQFPIQFWFAYKVFFLEIWDLRFGSKIRFKIRDLTSKFKSSRKPIWDSRLRFNLRFALHWLKAPCTSIDLYNVMWIELEAPYTSIDLYNGMWIELKTRFTSIGLYNHRLRPSFFARNFSIWFYILSSYLWRNEVLIMLYELQGAYWMLDVTALDEQQPLRMKVKPKVTDRVRFIIHFVIILYNDQDVVFQLLTPMWCARTECNLK